MYECPASIAPEPNNYISSRSFFFFLWLAEPRTHSSLASAYPAGIPPRGKSSATLKRSKNPSVPGSPCLSGLSDCCIYLQRRLRSVSPACAPHCVSIQPRSGRQTAPLPFQTTAGRPPKQKAGSANGKPRKFKRR